MTAVWGALRTLGPGRQRAAPPEIATPRLNLLDMIGQLRVGERANSGAWVTEQAALRISTVYRCIMLNATVRAMLPGHVIRDTGGDRQRIRPPAARVLWGRPNPEVSASVFWTTVFIHEESYGEAFVYVERNDGGGVAALWPIEPARVRVGRDPRTREKIYEIDGSLPQRDLSAGGNILHLMGPSSNGLRGVSPLRAAINSMGLAMSQEEYAARMFRQGTAVDGYLSTDQDLTQEQAEALSYAWETHHAGVANAHRPAVLGRGTRWNTVALNAEDSQLLLGRQFQVADLARFWGVPEHLVGAHDKQSSWGSGLEETTRGYLTFTLQPRITMDEQTISDALLPRGQVFKWEVAGLLRANLLQQAQRLAIERQNGIRTANEWRQLLDLPRREDPGGDAFYDPLNMASSGEGGGAVPAGTGED
jgi:HK97 family phage portal protein